MAFIRNCWRQNFCTHFFFHNPKDHHLETAIVCLRKVVCLNPNQGLIITTEYFGTFFCSLCKTALKFTSAIYFHIPQCFIYTPLVEQFVIYGASKCNLRGK